MVENGDLGLQETRTEAATSYDAVAYPSSVVWQTGPERMAAVAMLMGLAPPPVETARYLEIGAGDGMNLLSLAAAHPRASFVGTDIAASAIDKGREMIRQAGLGNARLEVLDILHMADRLEGPFDYIVAHGVYAWVPAPVREALMAVIGRLLAPDGVAYLSYNAKPGGQLRAIVREMALHEAGPLGPDGEGLDEAIAALWDFAQDDSDTDIVPLVMRSLARRAAIKQREILFHDELGPCFEPQGIHEVVACARAHGLDYLHDAAGPFARPLAKDGEDTSAQAVADRLMSLDYLDVNAFRWTLLIREGRNPSRTPDPQALRRLYLSSRAHFDKDAGEWSIDNVGFETQEEDIIAGLTRLSECYPMRLPVDEVFPGRNRDSEILVLSDAEIVTIHGHPGAFTIDAGERPRVSELARAQIKAGYPTISTLHNWPVQVTDEPARALLSLMDGTRDTNEIRAAWEDGGLSGGHPFELGLAMAMRMALIKAS